MAVTVLVALEDGNTLEQVVDADINAFDAFFQNALKNDVPLVGSERAILKTYLWWKTHEQSETTSSS